MSEIGTCTQKNLGYELECKFLLVSYTDAKLLPVASNCPPDKPNCRTMFRYA